MHLRRSRFPFLLLLSILWVLPSHAQDDNRFTGHVWDVYIERAVDEQGRDRLIFIDILTGQTEEYTTYGERYTPIGDSILFFNPARLRVMTARPEDGVTPVEFITVDGTTRRVDWVVSNDYKQIAWTVTSDDVDNALSTVTYVADITGDDVLEVLVDGPRQGIRAMPVAFSEDHSTLYMDQQPDGLEGFTIFDQYAGLFAVDLQTGDLVNLPGEPVCFCGAGFGDGLFLRLAPNSDQSGFDLHVYNLQGRVRQTIEAVRLRNYTQGGGILLSPDGTRAAYSLAQIQLGGNDRNVQTVLLVVDLDQMTQRPLNTPIDNTVQAVGWTEDNTAIIVTSPQVNGTWKVSVEGGSVTRVASASYIGTIQQGS